MGAFARSVSTSEMACVLKDRRYMCCDVPKTDRCSTEIYTGFGLLGAPGGPSERPRTAQPQRKW